jgi:hypothetical protein
MGPTNIRFQLKIKTANFPKDYENSVSTSQKTKLIFIINASLIILCKEVVAIGSEIHTEKKN